MTQTPREPVTRECYATAMRKASRRLTQLYDDALAPTGLRSTQYAILGELTDSAAEPPTLNQLADALVLDRSGLGHSLRPLERDGLIRLQKGSRDRRSTEVVLTDEGRRRFDAASPLWRNAQRTFAAAVGEGQADDLRAVLLGIAHDERLVNPA
jgi:DNA-binding MarR family transcriptional regulator